MTTTFTIKMLEDLTDEQIIAILISDRLVGKNPYTPQSRRLAQIRNKIGRTKIGRTKDGSIYPLADRPTTAEKKANGFCPKCDIAAALTREYRRPKKGEWYLSGAVPQAWRAPNDLKTEFNILTLVLGRPNV